MSNEQVVFCVAGMHRSGSSLFANWLQNCGIFIGENLLGAASSNPYGHFEDLDFLFLNSSELVSNNLDPSGLFGNLLNLKVSESFFVKAAELIDERSNKVVWGWKEPRTTLLLDDWKIVIPNLKVIIVQRGQDKIVNSLYARLKKNHWYLTNNPLKKIWWYIDIDLRPRKWKRVFHKTCIQYEAAWRKFQQRHPKDVLIVELSEFIHDHELQVKRINNFLELELPFNQLESVIDRNILN